MNNKLYKQIYYFFYKIKEKFIEFFCPMRYNNYKKDFIDEFELENLLNENMDNNVDNTINITLDNENNNQIDSI